MKKTTYFIALAMPIAMLAMEPGTDSFALAKKAIKKNEFNNFNSVADQLTDRQLVELYPLAVMRMQRAPSNLNCLMRIGLHMLSGASACTTGAYQIVYGVDPENNGSSINTQRVAAGSGLFGVGLCAYIFGIKYGITHWNSLNKATAIVDSMNERLRVNESMSHIVFLSIENSRNRLEFTESAQAVNQAHANQMV